MSGHIPDPVEVIRRWAAHFHLRPQQVTGDGQIMRQVGARAAITYELHDSGWYTKNEIATILRRDRSSVVRYLKAFDRRGRRARPSRDAGAQGAAEGAQEGAG